YLAMQRAYWWLCLHECSVNVWRGGHALVYMSCDLGKPLCSLDCMFVETSSSGSALAVPDCLGWCEEYYADGELLRGYDFIRALQCTQVRIPLGFGTYTTAQRAALKLAAQRKKTVSDAARVAMREEQRLIKAERKDGKRDARKASARKGKRGK